MSLSAEPLHCDGSATVMTDYHMCRYDPVLGVLVCIGDDCDVLVLGKNMCRRRIPVRRGVHWLDCFLYAGTCSVLLLSAECIECVNYQACCTDSSLSAAGGAKLACMHIPQGLTCGAVGRRSGVVSYFRLCDVDEKTHRLFWVVKETNVLEMVQPFVENIDPLRTCKMGEEEENKFFPFGSILSLDSLPENPNSFIGVVAGVPGVVEWSISSGKVSTFFSARQATGLGEGNILAACHFTPGGNYVVATTTDSSHVLVWDMGRKKKAKVSEVYWVVDLSASISHDVHRSSVEAFQYNEYRVGMYMARTTTSGSVSDKNSQWYLLINGQRDIVEVVLRVEDKTVVDQEQVIADLNVYTARKGIGATPREKKNNEQGSATANFFKVFHVEPCAPHCYWNSELTDCDLDSLIITSSGGLHPMVVKRKCSARGLESIQELKEINGEAPWGSHCLLLRLPLLETEAVLRSVALLPHHSAMDELLFGSSNLIDVYAKKLGSSVSEVPKEKHAAVTESWMATVIGWGEAFILSPSTHQILRPDAVAIQENPLWAALADKATSSILVEYALPAPATGLPAEVILRVYVTPDQIMVTKYAIRLGVGRAVLALDRSSFGLRAGTALMATTAVLADARIAYKSPGVVGFYPDGMCLVVVFEDSSIAFVDLGGRIDASTGEPVKFILRAADFLPSDTRVCAVQTFWGTAPAFAEEAFYTAALLEGGAGLLLWNMTTGQMHLYPQFSAPANRLLVEDAVPLMMPNMHGSIPMLSVDLSVLMPPTEPGVFGSVTLCDAAGGVLHSIEIGFGLGEHNDRVWCVRTSRDSSGKWRPTEFFLDIKRITLSCTIMDHCMHWKYASDVGSEIIDSEQGMLKGTISYVRATWPIGKALLYTQATPEEIPKRQVLVESTGKTKWEGGSPIILLIGKQHIASVDISSLLRRDVRRREGDVPTIRLDSSRSLEDVLLCAGKRLIAITRDDNGWRWINVLDVYTLKPCMTPFATLDFAGEERLKVLQIMNAINERVQVHLYLVGETNGTIGHYTISSQGGESTENATTPGVVFDPCWPHHYEPTPGSFRWYHRYLPRRPTQKAESNFFKRLMVSPWEDIAEELVNNTFQQVRKTVAESQETAPQSTPTPQATPAQKHVDVKHLIPRKHSPDVPSKQAAVEQQSIQVPHSTSSSAKPTLIPTAQTSPEAPGNRYAQLKALAQRENVSLIEARRMMSENVKKLQERAERLGAVANKSEELASRAMTFQDLARQLKEKKRNSWL